MYYLSLFQPNLINIIRDKFGYYFTHRFRVTSEYLERFYENDYR